MPDQLNFAAQEIIKKFGEAKNWFFTLNIDSKFKKDTFAYIIQTLNRNDRRIYQFSAFFLDNFNNLKGLNGYFLKAAALFQSRWTVVHELKRYRFNASRCFLAKYQLAHAVGHGLLIPADIYNRYRFPVDEIIENSPFGYLLRCEGHVMNPVRKVELGDSPGSLVDHIKQKYTWSFGPLGYLNYCRKYKIAFPENYNKRKIRIAILTLQGLLSAINWQFSSWIFAYLLVSCFCTPPLFCVAVISTLLLYSLDYTIVSYYFRRKSYVNFSRSEWLLLYCHIWIVILTHSIPANLAFITRILKRARLKKEITKFKTRHN